MAELPSTYYYGDGEYEDGYNYNYENEADPIKPLRNRRPHKPEFTYRKPTKRVKQTNTISNPPAANQDDSYYYSQVGRWQVARKSTATFI